MVLNKKEGNKMSLRLPKYMLPFVAAGGFAFAVYSVVVGAKQTPVSQHVAEPARAPFKSYIAGAGIIEAKSENINIGTPVAGIVAKIYVRQGGRVKAGDPLFLIDDRDARADLEVKRTALAQARAAVAEAGAALKDVKTQLGLAESVTDKRAISVDDLEHRRNAVLIAQARVDSSRAAVEAADAAVKAVETNLARLTVRAPVDGEILQMNIHPGEFAQAGAIATPLMMLGNLDDLHIRVDIDENDAWRFRKDSQAVASLRGNSDLKTRISFVRIEPYVVPKKSLTGDSTERVDTRVMQAIYSFDRKALPAYVGQQMDVFIEAPPFVPAMPDRAGNAPAKGSRS